MRLIEFPEQTTTIANKVPDYRAMHAHLSIDKAVFTCCWKLTWVERLQVLITGKIWQQIQTHGAPVQPHTLTVEKPEMR